MPWFGDPWPDARNPAPVCEQPAMRVPTPVGARCPLCDEEIVEGDRGELMLYMFDSDGIGVRPVHVECQLRAVLGGPAHLRGTCTCCGGTDDPDLGLSRREAALVVWESWTKR